MTRRLALLPLLFAAPAAAQQAAELPAMVVQAAPAEAPRQGVAPRLGVREVVVDRATLEALPQGGDAPLNQVLLQTPGVVQDSFGEIHVRGEHRGLQYRINGLALPEGLAGFGQVFDSRAFSSIGLLTGALPAQYGWRTNAVVRLETRSGLTDPGGSVGVYGGSRGTLQPHAAWAGMVQGWEVLASGNLLRSNQGIENPTRSATARHDATEQLRGFLSAARQLDERTRLTLMGDTALNRFEIPTRPGIAPAFGEQDSASLRARQWERGWFGLAAVQHALTPDVDVQVAGFTRSSSIHYLPDASGELAMNGVASDVRRASLTLGSQADATWRLHPDHTLRFGGQVSREQSLFRASSSVFPVDDAGAAIGPAFTLADRNDRIGWQYGAYAQDEWRLTERLTLNLGLRADQMVGNVAAGQLSPRANLVWRATQATTLHAGYARTFTPPAQELLATATLARYQGTSNAPFSLANDAVRPERAHRFSLGAAHELGHGFTLGAEAYYKSVQDLLDYGQFGNALIFTPFNYRQGRVYGVEFSGSWRSEHWLTYANLALSRSAARGIRSGQFNFEPDELAHIAAKYVRTDHDQLATGSAGAVYRAWEGGRISATTLYGSGMRRGYANSEKLPAHATLNLGVQQDVRLAADAQPWTLRLDVLNLLDARYPLRDGSGIGVGAPQFGARRGGFVGVSRSL